jgi:hypothetical protein
MMIRFTSAPGADLWISSDEIVAVRAALPNEFAIYVHTVIFVGIHKFGICEMLGEVVTILEDVGE